jgi:hypothetical protein
LHKRLECLKIKYPCHTLQGYLIYHKVMYKANIPVS